MTHSKKHSTQTALNEFLNQMPQSDMSLSREEQLLKVIERQKYITDNIPSLIAYWDKNERCRFANKAYFEWFGYTPEKLYGMTMRELLGEALYQKNKLHIVEALSGIPQLFERDLTRKLQQDLRHTQASYIPDLQENEVLGFFVLVTDITERKKAELTAIEAKDAAIKASQVKSRFLANMSHEIRTPMNGVIGMLNIALGSHVSSEVREYLEVARQSADHLLSIINDILDHSKIEAGEMTLSQHLFSLREAITSALSVSIMIAKRKGLDVSVIVDDQLPTLVVGDSVRLRQVLLNVFNNAVKFTTTGRITLKVFFKDKEKLMVHFQVEDTGIGISKEKIREIFKPFKQADETKTREFGGTGLGLSICKSLVQMMGGTISAESVPGKGSIFHFDIQLKEKTLLDADPKDSEKSSERRLRVLLVEDDLISAKIQTIMMQKLHCDVIHASNGQAAVEWCKKQSFDLILMDLQMPIMDGIEATKKIREQKIIDSDLQPTIVAITADTFAENRTIKAGMDDFLAKPVTITQLSRLTARHRNKTIRN